MPRSTISKTGSLLHSWKSLFIYQLFIRTKNDIFKFCMSIGSLSSARYNARFINLH